MDFSTLPDTPFLRIFDYLPWDMGISVGRTSKSFRRISQLVTSRTKSIDLNEDKFRNLSPYQFGVLLNLCCHNLERINFPETRIGSRFVATFSKFECPRLADIDLDYVSIGNSIFGKLIRNNRGIKSVLWRLSADLTAPEIPRFVEYPNLMNENLRSLTLSCCNDDSFRSMTGRMPNLVRLDVITKNITNEIFDEFLASVPRLEEFKIHSVDNEIVFENLVHIWNCQLISMQIVFTSGHHYGNDQLLRMVATRMPRLKNLKSWMSQATNEGVASLGNLRELEYLHISLPNDDFDDGICGLAECGQLREVDMCLSLVISTTLVLLLRSCPRLRLVIIRALYDVEDPQMAALVLESLSGMANRKVIIGFHSMDDDEEAFMKSIWNSEPVDDMIKHLKDTEGLIIEIDWIERRVMSEADELEMEEAE